MVGNPVEFLSPEQARQLVELAERTRGELGKLAERSVDYDATALQMLDEWIEREASPSQHVRVMWIAFLGEMFRRKYGGEWVLRQEGGSQLAVLCPTERGGVHQVEVAEQVHRRIANGMVDSLALFYLYEGSALREPGDF